MPGPSTTIDFPPCQLDLRAGELRRDGVPVHLRPKTFAVLQYLAERPSELVTKQALLDAVWGNVAVSEDVVRVSVGELREALGDQRAAPRFIETVPRRGYRFVAVTGASGAGNSADRAQPAVDDAAAAGAPVVGRARERAAIGEWLQAAASGRRQIGFVTGEAGIGKTTLVDAALEDWRRSSRTQLRVGRGQCVEHFGGGEPYMPVLEALGSLCRGADGTAVEQLLLQHAPDWLLDAMGLLAPRGGSRAAPAAGAREHTLHRLAASVDALAADTPLVLVLEDVHWSDYSTLDLLAVVAQRREPAPLLILCTLRPAEAIVRGHPVAAAKRELLRKGLCREILLGGLSAADVASYLAARFVGATLPGDLLPLLVDRSDGSPLFLVALVDHLLERGLLVGGSDAWELGAGFETLRTAIPAGLRAVIEPRLESLGIDERRILEAASVVGPDFPAHVVAHSASADSDLTDVEYVEQLCDTLALRQDILRAAGECVWPDGTASARYAFRHAVYQDVVYQGLSSSARRRLHQTIGEQLETAYRGRTAEIASVLAAHFERSRDGDRAVRYHAEAAAHARSRVAYQETRLHLEAALAILREQPETPERLQQEISLLQDLGSTLFALKGYGDEGAARTFARMRALAERLDVAPMRLRALDGLLLVHTMRAELTTARALGEEMLALAEPLGNRVATANSHISLGATLLNLGETEAAHHHAEQARALFDPQAAALPMVLDLTSRSLLASTRAHLGRVAEARAISRDLLARAAALDTPYLRAHATNFAAQFCMLLRDVPAARSLADETRQLAAEYGFSVIRLTATMIGGWCDVEDGEIDSGLGTLRDAFDDYAATGQRISTTSFSALLATAHLAAGDAASAHAIIDAALAFAAETGERINEPELHRLRGESLLAAAATRGEKGAATASFERALAIAAAQKARLFELRAATSLCRMQKSARDRLARLVDRFDTADDCADLRAAQVLLGRR